jgi:uncharacterized membrane protein
MKGISKCAVTGEVVNQKQAIPVQNLRNQLFDLLLRQHPKIDQQGVLSISAYGKLMRDYVEETLQHDKGELTRMEKEVLKSIQESELLSKNVDVTYSSKLTLGEKMADRIADFGGSWRFVLSFFAFLIIWMLSNVFLLTRDAFDPYPFILLNLLLSALAAFQAPIIMMSQNRVEARDRIRAEHDYQVNLKAELEIRSLHEKMDHLLMRQMQHLVEIQQFQLDILEKLSQQKK